MKLLQVNTVANGGSIAAYMADIASEATRRGWTPAIAFGRRGWPDHCMGIRIGSTVDRIIAGAATRLADMHGLTGKGATLRFIDEAERFGPDIIHLHNIHGYYLHYPTLFEWLRGAGVPVVWSLHDLWPITGHCPTPDAALCKRWKSGCGNCPLKGEYPSSIADRSRRNLEDKRKAFSGIPRMTLLPVSQWLDSLLPQSILAEYPHRAVGIDVDRSVFKPEAAINTRKIVLGVANVWDNNKNPAFFRRLRESLDPEVEIRLVGRLDHKNMPGISLAGYISDPAELAKEYASATVFVNPSLSDNFPMANREAAACGTPVVTRAVGGSAEGLEGHVFAAAGDEELVNITKKIINNPPPHVASKATSHLDRLFEIYGSL